MKSKFKVLMVIALILTVILAIGFVNASNSKNYLLEVIDDGSNNLNGNLQTEITKKIVEDNGSNLVYEVNLKNKLDTVASKEVTILVDTSRSIDINDSTYDMQTKAAELAGELCDRVPGIRISVADSNGVKLNNSSSKSTIVSTIQNLKTGNSKQIDEGIEATANTFSSTQGKKYLIVFTDATDKMDSVSNIQANGVEVITVLKDMTRSSYVVDGVSTVGTIYMLDQLDTDTIINSLNNAINNVVVTDEFTDEIAQYFDFDVESKADTDEVQKTSNGYIWKAKYINAQTTATLKFRLTLKDNVNIDSGKVYRELNTSKNMTVAYNDLGQTRNYTVNESPVIVICEKYSLTIQTVSEENSELPVEGIQLKVVGQDEKGKVVYSNILTSDSNGKIQINDLRTLGKIHFTITPSVNKIGYASTQETEMILYNDATGKGLSVETDGLENSVNNVSRNVSVKLPITTQKFKIDLNLTEENNSNVKLGDTEFRLIQPKLNSKYELNALYGSTDQNGYMAFYPTVMTQAGTYDYIISQISSQDGYESIGNVTLSVTFDDQGQVTKVQKLYNDKVTAQHVNSSYIKLNITNKNELTDVFNFEINLTDEINKNAKLEGATYDVEVTTESGKTVTYSDNKTDKNGKINLTLPGSGYVQVKVTEKSPRVGYFEDKTVKEMIIYRKEGNVKYVAKTTPTDLNTVVDTYGNKVTLNLTSKVKANQSSIQIQLADMQENDIFIPNVKFKLYGTMTNEEYEGTTDEEGKINFLIQAQDQGIYQYKLVADDKTIPSGYSEIDDDILVSVTFNADREISDASDIQGPIWDAEKIEFTEGEFEYKTAYFGIGLNINEQDAYNFKVNLKEDEKLTPIPGASYDITIDNGTTVRKISGRKTASDGTISTRLIPSDDITITVKQSKSVIGYVINDQEQQIVLKRTNGVYRIENQDPYDYSDGKNGAVIEGKNIVYYNTNVKKGNDNILLNLYVNKADKQGNLLGYVPLRVYSSTLQNQNGEALNEKVSTDENGYLELEKLLVTGVTIPQDSLHELYIVETDTDGKDIDNTLVKLKLTFRYNDNKQIVELTNVESTQGNRLVKNKTFDGYETDIAYESNLYLDIYGNYQETGNFSLNLTKKNMTGEVLNGAKYNVTVTRPDGTKLIRNDLEITDDVEFEGFYVSKGTKIEITEKEAPIGYEVNEYTEILNVTDVSETGEVTVELEKSPYASPRASITEMDFVPVDKETVKTCVDIDLLDQELNTFKLGITTKDKETSKGISGFKYEIYTDQGAQVTTEETTTDGKINTEIGGSHSDKTVVYTITEVKTATYYKKLEEPIKMNVVFDQDGKIKSIDTMDGQTDTNFKTTWNILDINVNKKDDKENDINIEILNDHQDPLTVQLQTVDRITGNEINDISYKITPSVTLPAEGTTEIQVGYVAPSSTQTYTIEQTTENNAYKKSDNQTFKITYDENGEIYAQTDLSDELEFVSKSEKTIKMKLFLEPKTPIVINSIGYFDNNPLEGSEYNVSIDDTEKIDIATNENGIATGVCGVLGKDSETTYTVTQTKAAEGTAKVDSFKIKVHYNSDRQIDNVTFVGQANRWISVTYKQPSEQTDAGYNGNDKGIVQITIKQYPEFVMNIENEDILDNSTKISGTLYSVESTIGTKDEEVLTGENGIGVANLDKTTLNEKVVYTISETRQSPLYQKIEKDVKVEVTFDEDGYVKKAEVIDGQEFATVSKIDNITTPADNFVVNAIIKSRKILKFNITATDSVDTTYVLRNVKFEAKSNLGDTELSTDTAQTDVNGKAMLKLDKDLANQTITYTIKETSKLSGYQFPSEDLKIEISFDSNGKVIKDSVRITQGSGYTEILNIDVDNFAIDLRIVNDETQEFGLGITSVDKYDSSIKLENVNYEAYLTTADYGKDTSYTGTTTTGTDGEGYIQFGKYSSSTPNSSETRTLRISETNLPEEYRAIRAEIAVNVTFDANGIITDTALATGYDGNIGWKADERFISVTHTRHTVQVTIRHYPYLFMNVKAEDMYTHDTLAAQYTISTSNGPAAGITNIDYVGSGLGEILSANYNTTDDNQWAKAGIGPTELGTSRTYYIYEMQEPTSPLQYQKYRPRLITIEYSRIIGTITVNYNNKGRIEGFSIDAQNSNNNIKNFIDVQVIDGTNLGITIKYAPTTKMEVSTIDSITKKGLPNTHVAPFINQTSTTGTSYEYRTIGYYTTDKNGDTSYTYWGGNINLGQNEYHIDTALMGYNGYFGSGTVKIKVAYDEYGRISSADVLSTDENGEPNAEVVSFKDNVLKINILYNRKFNVKINKIDSYDDTMKNLSAQFNVTTNVGDNVDVKSSQLTTVGMVRPGQTVKYTLSEKIVPQGFVPIKNMDFYVTFKDDGTVEKMWSDSDLFNVDFTKEAVDEVKPTMEKDAEISIKNIQRFNVKLQVVDDYYKDKGLSEVTFEITNSKGDKAIGNPVTDSTGNLSAYIGTVYPNEKVTYTIKQTSTPNGYYDNNKTITFDVEYNEQGKIKNYNILTGNDIVTVNTTKYQNERYIQFDYLSNKPKDVILGIKNYDKLTKEPVDGATYEVTAQEIINGSAVKNTSLAANNDGTVTNVVDQFKESTNQRVVEYTISQTTIPNSYRKIQDIVLQVRYNEDGSMASANVISNPSNTKVSFALGGKLQKLNDEDVHILVEIPNDNAYDLIVKNEDKNYAGLGVEGTKYDVSINGEKLDLTTDATGIASILSRTEVGNITIRISENEIGKGYRSELNNDTTLELTKGEQEYSLTLDSNSNPTYATVDVNEDYGTITVTFKNETKYEMTILKDDINNGKELSDVQFEITAQEKDANGGNIGDATTITTVGVNDTTDKEGKMYFDLGATPQNKIIEYTFKEIKVPDGYNLIDDIHVTVQFDMYGKVKETLADSYRAKTSTGRENPNNVIVMISNGVPEDEKLPYTVKVVSQEVDNNLRINKSRFDIRVQQEDSSVIQEVKEQTGDVAKNGYLLEKGAIEIKKLKNDGKIQVYVDETEAAKGYKFGNQITSGTVKLNVEYQDANGLKDPQFTIEDNAGFDVSVDDTNNVITIKVNNEPESLMGITNVLQTKDEEGNIEETNIEGAKFVITSKIQTKTDITDTDLDVTTAKTDATGYTEAKVGIPYLGKTVLYTIHQVENEDYETIGDIVVLVEYNTKGLIKYYEVISNPDDAQVLGKKDSREIYVKVNNTIRHQKHGYKIVLEKHHIYDEEYGQLIAGAKYKIEVEQEYGEYNTTWESITNSDGTITSDLFDGYGNINIRLTEIEAPEGFKLDGETKELRVKRDKNTGKITIVSSDVNYEFNEDYSIIYVKPVDEPKDELYTIILNKTDKKTGKQIIDKTAEFKVNMIETESDGTETETYLGRFTTDNKGKARLERLHKPSTPGTYKYEITETKEPEGYQGLTDPVVLQVEFVENDQGEIVMGDNPTIISGEATIVNQKNDLLNIRIDNLNEQDINKYTLDITKVDAETGDPIESMALFKVWLPDDQNTALYAETMNNDLGEGKLDYCYIEQDKDYSVRLTRMEIPKEEGTLKYVFKEIVAPEGYAKVDEDLELNIEFKKDQSTGEMYIENITSSNDEYLRINTQTPCSVDTILSIDILNKTSEQSKFTIHYDANDNGEGTAVPEDQIKEKDVDLILDTMEPYRKGYNFKGWATLPTAKDAQFKAGDTFTFNQDITLYAVWEDGLYLTSDKYIISTADNYMTDANQHKYVEGDNYIFGIKPAIGAMKNKPENEGTNLERLKQDLQTNADSIQIIQTDNKVLGTGDLIGTGMKLVLTKGKDKIELTTIVLGDINGNGVLDGSDKTNASKYITLDQTSRFDTPEKVLALDVKMDGKIRPSDLTVLRKALSNDDNTEMGV